MLREPSDTISGVGYASFQVITSRRGHIDRAAMHQGTREMPMKPVRAKRKTSW